MSKGPPQLPSNPFSRPDTLAAPSRSAHGGFSDGIKIDTPSMKVSHEEMVAPPHVNDPNAKANAEKAKTANPDAKSAVAGFDGGSPASTKAIESADFPGAKKNPFDRKPKVEVKPQRPEVKSNGPEVVTTSKGLEVAQVRAQNPDDFAQRLKEAQKPAEIKEITTDNYIQAYAQQERERLEAQKEKAKQQQTEMQKAQETSKNSSEDQTRSALEAQAQMARNAALANQARELQAKMAQLRSQMGSGDNSGINAAIEECRIQLAQIPSGLQG